MKTNYKQNSIGLFIKILKKKTELSFIMKNDYYKYEVIYSL